jgi:hypothetical protein
MKIIENSCRAASATYRSSFGPMALFCVDMVPAFQAA